MESGKLKIDIGNVYDSMHNNSGLPYYSAYCELIDNSIDNGASIIQFHKKKNSIVITDNGTGIASTTQHMMNVLRMYQSTRKDLHNKIGQYGIGLKEASMRLGQSVKITSLMEGYLPIEIIIFWKTITDYTEGASYRTLMENIEPGTKIEIEYDASENSIPTLPGLTAFRFYNKIIEAGNLKIIQVDGTEYIPETNIEYKTGPEIHENLSIGEKKIDVEIGILKPDAKVKSGFYVYSTETLRYYKFAETRLSEIVKGIEARDGLYVSIGLQGTKTDWPVDKNKRDIINIDLVANSVEFFNILEKWKAKLYNETRNDILSKIEHDIASCFNLNAVSVGQEKRNKKEDGQKGTIHPKGTAKKRNEAEDITPHDNKFVIKRNGKKKMKGLTIVSASFNPNKYLTVEETELMLTIKINKSNSFISDTLKNSTEYKQETLKHFIYMALKTHFINPNEIKFNLVDEVFYQHELLNKT